MTLGPPTGRLLDVNLSEAINQGRVGVSVVGAPAMVAGNIDQARTLKADAVMRAKGKSLWGEDHDQ